MHTKTHPSFWLDWLILGGFTAAFVASHNYEFLLYTVSLAVLITLVQRTDRRLHYPAAATWGFMAWLILHMCGGFIHVGGLRLYDVVLLPLAGAPYHILRYDQFVHIYCYVVLGLVLLTVVRQLAATGTSRSTVRLITWLAAVGLGGVNEMIEFTTVAAFGSTGVGDYFNNSLDLFCNALGAAVAIFLGDASAALPVTLSDLPSADGTHAATGPSPAGTTRRSAPAS